MIAVFAKLRHVLPLIVLQILLNSLAGPSFSQQPEQPDAGAGPLDGMVFVGQIGDDPNPDFAEELHFNNGLFWSKLCVNCGFQPGPYWIRQVHDETWFQGQLTKQDGSIFTYQGRVSGTALVAEVRWQKSRWYWSIDKQLIFRGTYDPQQSATTARQAGTVATAALLQPLPDWCP